MIDKNNLIIIYGKAGSYKSSLGISLLNNCDDNICYIDLEGNNQLKLNKNIDIYNNIELINYDFIVNCIEKYNTILIDYIELLDYKIDDIINLKKIVDNTNKTLILISCCSIDKDLFNDKYKEYKKISDLLLLTDKK